MKNRIINGAMVIDQRNAGASVSTSSGGSVYSLDRWQAQYSQTSKYTVQQNAGSVTNTGYVSGAGAATSTTGFVIASNFTAATTQSGSAVLTTLGSNIWVNTSVIGASGGNTPTPGTGYITLGGTLDRVRITTVNGTDTFDAGSINILYE
jgi:hypothetical protein